MMSARSWKTPFLSLKVLFLLPALAGASLGLAWAATAAAANAAAGTAAAAKAAPDPSLSSWTSAVAEVPADVRAGIEAALQDKVKALMDLKNEEGASYVRAAYSKQFRRVDDSTYEVDFHKDTATKDKLVIERYKLTLKKNPGTGKWAVASARSRISCARRSRICASKRFTAPEICGQKRAIAMPTRISSDMEMRLAITVVACG